MPGTKALQDIAPSVGVAVEIDDLGGLAIINMVVQQNTHRSSAATEDDELNASVGDNGHRTAIYKRIVTLGAGDA